MLAATTARLLARRGHDVLALDSDMMPGLSLSLGVRVPEDPPLNAAAEKTENGRWRLRKGIGPVRAVRRYSIEAPDGVRLLQAGKNKGTEGLASVMGAVTAFHSVIHRIREASSLERWAIVGDLSAGPRQTAYDWAPYADRMLLVAEPTAQSMLTARRIVRIARARREVEPLLVVNKVAKRPDVRRVEDALGLEALAAVPLDEDVRAAERLGVALLDHAPGSRAVGAIEGLVERLDDGTLRSP